MFAMHSFSFARVTTENGFRRVSSLSSWFETVVLQRPNPFVKHIQESTKIPSQMLIPWKDVRPVHADKASAIILKDFQENLSKLQPPTTPESILELQAEWSSLYRPVSYYEQILSILAIGTEPPPVQTQWELAHASFTRHAREIWDRAVTEKESSVVTKWFEQETRDDGIAATPQLKRWWKYWQNKSGATLSKEKHAEWSKWHSALSGIRDDWMDMKPSQSRQWLPLLYSHIGSQQAMARDVWGYKHVAEYAGTLRYAQESLIVSLNEAVVEKIVPRVMLATEKKQDPRLKNLLKEKIFSLEAVLVVLQQLYADVFRVKLTWSDNSGKAWHPDVRSLQVSFTEDGGADTKNDKSKLVYLDLFARVGKPQVSAAIPLSSVATVVSLNLESPVWDTDTVFMTFEEVIELFHEMGHVLQQLSPAEISTIGANPSWPVDWVELLPKVRACRLLLVHVSLYNF
jgi:Zn-dependent oligopeptidase